jgi:hypothetical protein
MCRTFAASLAFIGSMLLCCTANADCSLSTLQGRYIFSGRGFIEPLAPNVQRVHAGYYVFDGAGVVSGKETSSRAATSRANRHCRVGILWAQTAQER